MFNLDDYEDVAARVLRFQKAYPEGRIVTDVIQFDAERGMVLISAQIYRNAGDSLPAGVDYAFGEASTYNASMRKFYVEDTSSSAIGRALSLVLESQKKPTKQDMAKVVATKVVKPSVQDLNAAIKAADTEPAEQDYWTTPVNDYMKVVDAPVTLDKAMENITAVMGTAEAAEMPQCKHGSMVWKTGHSAKTGKDWAAYQCTALGHSGFEGKCPAIWYEVGSDGKWRPQKVRG
jgi:hypothetical protein